jgi:hypothetical protein
MVVVGSGYHAPHGYQRDANLDRAGNPGQRCLSEYRQLPRVCVAVVCRWPGCVLLAGAGDPGPVPSPLWDSS